MAASVLALSGVLLLAGSSCSSVPPSAVPPEGGPPVDSPGAADSADLAGSNDLGPDRTDAASDVLDLAGVGDGPDAADVGPPVHAVLGASALPEAAFEALPYPSDLRLGTDGRVTLASLPGAAATSSWARRGSWPTSSASARSM
jgi:hypothetical protein